MKADRIEQELVYLEKAGMKNGSHFFLFSQPFQRSALRASAWGSDEINTTCGIYDTKGPANKLTIYYQTKIVSHVSQQGLNTSEGI